MLFCYPADANDDNWLHDTVLQILFSGMDQIDAGQAPDPWPGCIPADRVEELGSRHGLRDRRNTFLTAYESLDLVERTAVREAVGIQNAFPALFDGVSACVRLKDLPDSIRKPAEDLFRFAFELLTPLGLRDAHYHKIYDQLQARICPFCGIERLDAPGQPREDLDHYLPITTYPFAGANLRNLSPMGGRCNGPFKRALDVLFDAATDNRRRCSDPYGGPTFEISLANSVPFEGKTVGSILCPEWNIEFVGLDPVAAETWNSVFKIRDRYVSSLLNPEFRDWMSHFANWAVRSDLTISDKDETVDALGKYVTTCIQEGLAESAFLKRAMFGMLRDHCADGPQSERLVSWLISLVSIHAQPDAA